MNEEEKREYEELKSLLYTGTISQYGKRKLIDIIEKQQKEIKARLEEIDSLYKMMSVKYEEIEKLEDVLRKERFLNKSALETLKECVHKDTIKEIIEKHKNFLSSELSIYDENDIENRKAIQYASARLSFLLMDILGKDTLNSLYGTMTKESEDN